MFQKTFPEPLVRRIRRHGAHAAFSWSPNDNDNPPLNGHAQSFVAFLATAGFILEFEWVTKNHLLEFVRTDPVSPEVGNVLCVPVELRIGGHTSQIIGNVYTLSMVPTALPLKK
jgi:hypothetical protein